MWGLRLGLTTRAVAISASRVARNRARVKASLAARRWMVNVSLQDAHYHAPAPSGWKPQRERKADESLRMCVGFDWTPSPGSNAGAKRVAARPPRRHVEARVKEFVSKRDSATA